MSNRNGRDLPPVIDRSPRRIQIEQINVRLRMYMPYQQNPPFPPQPPQQQSRRMIQIQLLSKPQLLPHPLCPQPPQQQRRRMIQIRFPHPQEGVLLSHPHPQFVAAKSLMLFPPEISLHFKYMQDGMSEFNEYQQKFSIAV